LRSRPRHPSGPAALSILALAAAVPAGALAQAGSRSSVGPSSSTRRIYDVLPRDAIRSIDAPRFVEAHAVRASVPSQEPFMGFALGGEAHVYSLNLLDSHEIVNDEIGGTPFAATW